MCYGRKVRTMIVTYVGGGASSLVLRSSAICTYVTTAKSIQPFPHSTHRSRACWSRVPDQGSSVLFTACEGNDHNDIRRLLTDYDARLIHVGSGPSIPFIDHPSNRCPASHKASTACTLAGICVYVLRRLLPANIPQLPVTSVMHI